MVQAGECTAAEHTRNPLMTPPCDCPRCAPPPVPAEANGVGTIWLRVDGRPQRHDVTELRLGSAGHVALG